MGDLPRDTMASGRVESGWKGSELSVSPSTLEGQVDGPSE